MRRALPALLAIAIAAPLSARPLCLPCAGLSLESPEGVAELLAAGGELPDDGYLFIKWRVDPHDPAGEAAAAIRGAGGLPWLAVTFTTPPPLLQNLTALRDELRALASLAGSVPEATRFQLLWQSEEGRSDPAEYAFLIKRAAVAINGARPGSEVFSAPLAANESFLRALAEQEAAAYLDGIALKPAPPAELERAVRAALELDPDSTIALDALPGPTEPLEMLSEAARHAALGISIVLFERPSADAESLRPLELLAREFRGDISHDPFSAPRGAEEAWSFVRGEDLFLRVVVRSPRQAERLLLEFPDPALRSPVRYRPGEAEPLPEYGLRSAEGFEVELEAPERVTVLGLERMTAAELEGVEALEEAITVEDIRKIPVEEILRRLQAFEDSQSRRLRHYSAVNTTHLRFQFGTGSQTFEATFRGDFFFRQEEGFDWAWQEFLINGVKWRHRTIPEIPLIQPEKATALPAEITFTKEYRYRLRGTETVEGRDCWVVDFEPAVAVEPGRSLYQGTVWVDREIYARVRTRAVQLGLAGDVLSNEETLTFSPLDAAGEPAPWHPSSYFLPLRLVGQQVWSVLSATPVVEREILLSEVRVNGEDFDDRRQVALDSEVTMVRDTEAGLRYLVADKETGERVVKEELDRNRRFLVGGVFYDESQDFPIPLAGINWLWFDWRGSGTQANVFFAGALFNVAVTDPDFLGSRFDLGFDVFALAFAGTDNLFRDGREVPAEDVEVLSPNIDFKLGRAIGSFFKLDLQYELNRVEFSRADDTAADFVLPRDHFHHSFSLTGKYNRKGYRLRAGGTYNRRGDWERWGLPGNLDFDPDQESYFTWGVGLGKTWHFSRFRKVGAEIEYVDGSDLDRFSKFGFGPFSNLRVRGYQSGKVRAEEALALHLSYGFDVGQLFRLDLVGDAAWASDEASGLDRELLAGAGVAGTVIGPWRTLMNIDLGVALAGPDDGVSVFLAFLKLFR